MRYLLFALTALFLWTAPATAQQCQAVEADDIAKAVAMFKTGEFKGKFIIDRPALNVLAKAFNIGDTPKLVAAFLVDGNDPSDPKALVMVFETGKELVACGGPVGGREAEIFERAYGMRALRS